MYNGIPYLINPYANFGYPYPYLYPYYPSAPHMPMQLTPEMLQQLQNLQQPSFPSSYPQPSTPQTIPATPVSSLPPENENPPAFQQNANGQGAHNLQGRAQEPAARQVAVRRVNSLGLFLKLCFFLYLFTRDASFERTIVLHIVAAIIFLYQTGRIRVIRVQRQIVPRPGPDQQDQQQQQQQQESPSTATSSSATPDTNPPPQTAARPRRLLPELQSIIFSFFGALVPGHLQEDVAHNAAAMIAAQQQQDRERAGDLEVAGAGVGAGGVGGVGGVM
ncbi:hypothetical protein BKA69DRAFT_1079555 [Paraphysoderma sedebokerense]|nr:hypothetical protein BKA69DRAFT_1079555 [Paraphysoderma sedebokerense]